MPRVLAVLAVLLIGGSAFAQTQPATQRAAVRIVLAGDSTVTGSAGWGGEAFRQNFGQSVEIINFARGGRSSKSFRNEGRWQQVLDLKPNYVLIQFGHNDEPNKGPDRATDAAAEFRANMARYVDETRAAGAKPVLVTPLARRQWKGDDGRIQSSLVGYVESTKSVAAEKNVPLIDLHERSLEVYYSLGRDGCEEHISPPKETGGYDGTHLNANGRILFGCLMADALTQAVPELRRYRINYKLPTERAVPSTRPSTVVETRAAEPTPQGEKTITVAADGSGDFRRIQDAIAAVPDNNADRTTIRIKPGVYYGQFYLPRSKQNVTLLGEDRDTTILSYGLNVYDPIPTGVSKGTNGCGLVPRGSGFVARNLTIRNTSGDHGQAMAVRNEADRSVFDNCRLEGWQDTLLTHSGRQYYKDCYIEGRVDFIYGGAAAVFENCEIRSKSGGYVTAASTPETQPYGYVFLHCRLTSTDNVPTYLGRPWRPFAYVAYINCEMGSHIRPEGWHNWGKPDNEKTARYFEFNSTGPGANPDKRVPWSRQITKEQADAITVPAVLRGQDGWDPTR